MKEIFSVGYSVEKNQYALAINNKLYITDKDKNVIKVNIHIHFDRTCYNLHSSNLSQIF